MWYKIKDKHVTLSPADLAKNATFPMALRLMYKTS